MKRVDGEVWSSIGAECPRCIAFVENVYYDDAITEMTCEECGEEFEIEVNPLAQ